MDETELTKAAHDWTDQKSDEFKLCGIMLEDKTAADDVAYVNDVVEMAFIAGARWAKDSTARRASAKEE